MKKLSMKFRKKFQPSRWDMRIFCQTLNMLWLVFSASFLTSFQSKALSLNRESKIRLDYRKVLVLSSEPSSIGMWSRIIGAFSPRKSSKRCRELSVHTSYSIHTQTLNRKNSCKPKQIQITLPTIIGNLKILKRNKIGSSNQWLMDKKRAIQFQNNIS